MSALRQQSFDTIAQRVLYGYRFVLTDCQPMDSELATQEAQRQWHACMADLLDCLCAQPELLALPLDPDDAYDWYTVNNQRPALDTKYMAIFKALHSFFQFLYHMALEGTSGPEGFTLDAATAKARKLSYKPCYAKALKAVGLTLTRDPQGFQLIDDSECSRLCAMRLLACHCKKRAEGAASYNRKHLFDFIRCAWSGAFDDLLDKIDAAYAYGGMLMNLRATCLQRGYTPFMHADVGPTGFHFSISFLLNVGGFHMGYNPRKIQQFYFGTKNGIGEKKMLEDFDRLNSDMQAYFLRICRPCRHCQGCTKGGKSRPFTVTVRHQGQEHALCPQFPRHEWPEYNPEQINLLLQYHDLQERYV